MRQFCKLDVYPILALFSRYRITDRTLHSFHSHVWMVDTRGFGIYHGPQFADVAWSLSFVSLPNTGTVYDLTHLFQCLFLVLS